MNCQRRQYGVFLNFWQFGRRQKYETKLYQFPKDARIYASMLPAF